MEANWDELHDQLKQAKTCLLHMHMDNEGIYDLFQEKQAIQSEMNQKIRDTIAEIEHEYVDRIRDIDTQLMMYIQLNMPQV